MNIDVPVLSNELVTERQSPAWGAMRRFLHHRSAQVGLAIFFVMLLAAIFASLIAPFDPEVPLDNVKRRSGPCIHLLGCPADQSEHIMGIDSNNRDLFSRVIFGA